MLRINSIDAVSFKGKRVLLRIDINSPLDRKSGTITNNNRIVKSVPTIRELSNQGAKLVIIAHQGDTTDYTSLIGLQEHAKLLSSALQKEVKFIEDIAGPAAVQSILDLRDGEILLLDNLRYFAEEVSTFEDCVNLRPEDMKNVYLVRRLSPVFDCYVNDAFSAAHRNAPSMVAFQELLPSYGGRLLISELNALQSITANPARPCVYLLGGSRAGDAFGMIHKALTDDTVDCILTSGLVGQIFMLADGLKPGEKTEKIIRERGYLKFVKEAEDCLSNYRDKIQYPIDVAYQHHGKRHEQGIGAFPIKQTVFDIGEVTIHRYTKKITQAQTVFVNGPPGVYEEENSCKGTRVLWKVVEAAPGFTVIGGGDTVTSFTKFTDTAKLNYVSTAGGALIRYLSGTRLPLLQALEKAYERKVAGGEVKYEH